MAKKDVTIEGVKKAKAELETAVTKLLQDFEKDYGVKLGYLDVRRKRDKNDIDIALPCEPSEYNKKPIETVDINMNLDLF